MVDRTGQDKYDIVTIWRGRDSVSYEAEDFYKNGENATPIAIRQNPSDKASFVKMKLQDADGIGFYTNPEADDKGNDLAKWDVKALKRLLKSAKAGEDNGTD